MITHENIGMKIGGRGVQNVSQHPEVFSSPCSPVAIPPLLYHVKTTIRDQVPNREMRQDVMQDIMKTRQHPITNFKQQQQSSSVIFMVCLASTAVPTAAQSVTTMP